jgi:hypothetical protein
MFREDEDDMAVARWILGGRTLWIDVGDADDDRDSATDEKRVAMERTFSVPEITFEEETMKAVAWALDKEVDEVSDPNLRSVVHGMLSRECDRIRHEHQQNTEN